MATTIKQDNVTEDTKFRGALSEEINKKIVSGLDWNKENGEFIWIVDETLFNKQQLDIIEEKFMNTYPKGCKDFVSYFRIYFLLTKDILSVHDILDNWRLIETNINHFTIEGEVEQIIPIEDTNISKIILREYIYNENRKRNETLYLDIIINNDYIKEKIKRLYVVKITGKISSKTDKAYDKKVFVNATSIEKVSNEPFRFTEWRLAIKDEWLQLPKNDFSKRIKKLTVITSKSSNNAALGDFKAILKGLYVDINDATQNDSHLFQLRVLPFRDKTRIHLNNTIIYAAKFSDCLCIIRGGGNPYDLLQFSATEVLEAIFYARKNGVPVVTGIGHAKNTDHILCNQVVDKACITPSEAARFFIDLYNNWKQQ